MEREKRERLLVIETIINEEKDEKINKKKY
jgi:hypothetical protein